MAKTKKSPSKLEIQQKYNRTFSEAFKRSKVKDLESGLLTIKELCSQWSISRTSVYKWIYTYSIHHQQGNKQVVQNQSEGHKTQQLKARIKDLEQVIGQKQLELDYVSKLLELASEDLGYDLKKSIEQQLSNGSDPIDPKAAK